MSALKASLEAVRARESEDGAGETGQTQSAGQSAGQSDEIRRQEGSGSGSKRSKAAAKS